MKKTFFFLGLIMLSSCGNTNNDQALENLDKKSSREVTLTTVTEGDTVYHLTKQTIWINGEKIADKVDTLTTKLQENSWGADTTSMKLNQIPIYVTVQ
ncbi:hypothetical protein H1R17_08900 [Flavobacterium sp. xlx-214]|uniref:hypothetical protein n=1 Tax=unclassified Flavobacterium TaxID=196869 RepID=UPI0013D4E365|nr:MULTISPECIES: hypothetical protein [unclassified Flavobacterium]MBA5793115.1 hypothetical protein [Flavobacterium sp. xlx-221]QMI82598.1 hypothetical protein H1R17_08900 [Flavobacterium sp. xlx-214]